MAVFWLQEDDSRQDEIKKHQPYIFFFKPFPINQITDQPKGKVTQQ